MSKIIHEVSFAIEATLLLSFILIRKRAFVALTSFKLECFLAITLSARVDVNLFS